MFSRCKNLRSEAKSLRQHFEMSKVKANERKTTSFRSDLMGNSDGLRTRSNDPLFMTNRYQNSSWDDYNIRENDFVRSTDNQLDAFLAQGSAILENLRDQRSFLKGTKKRLLDAANGIGLGKNVVGFIERRS